MSPIISHLSGLSRAFRTWEPNDIHNHYGNINEGED